jgi:hypothetical protein
MSNRAHHVVPNDNRGGWDIKRGRGKRAIKHFANKNDAISYAKELCDNQGTALVLHEKDGSVRKKTR